MINILKKTSVAIIFVSFTILTFGRAFDLINRKNNIKDSQKLVKVFYPKYIDEQCPMKIDSLKRGKLDINGFPVSTSPDWTIQNYNLHSLRFLDCLIWKAERGNKSDFDLAKKIILDWDEKNEFETKVHNWTWEDNEGAWEEHGVSWRAVLLSYFYQVVKKVSPEDKELIIKLKNMARYHGKFLTSKEVYMPDHNHGLNNALGLLALGIAFHDLPNANKWIDLSIMRAEQQMKDNVSIDGIHLEHSGFYHFYTLRTFIEIYQTARLIDRPLSERYRLKLDKMLKVGALMASVNGEVEGIPWTVNFNAFEFIKNIESLNLGKNSSGKNLFLKTKFGRSKRNLFVKKVGGYSFFVPEFGKGIEIVFHTQILRSPHFQEDAMGLTSMLGNQRILSYGNYNSSSRKAKDFNIVQVGNLKQFSTIPKPHRKVPLRKRLLSSGGEVVSFGNFEKLDFVTAKNRVYFQVDQTRTVARIGTHYLLVWDRLEADKEHEYTQSFHFAVPLNISLKGKTGTANLGQKEVFQFIQLAKANEIISCEKLSESQLCSWEYDETKKRIPTPEINYLSTGKKVEFIWVLYAGGGEWSSSIKTAGNRDSNDRVIHLSGDGGNYRVRLQDLKVILEE